MRLKNVDVGEGSLSPEQITEFIDQMQVYEGAMYEISTKLEILDSEFQVRFSHNPINHIERRLKSLNSILGKLQRRNLPLTVDAIKDNLFDVAGVRVICNYRDDVYSVANYLSAQSDIQVLRVKDYIKNPKQNGYRSLHVIYAVPVFLSSGPHYTPVEVQLRTIAMDYWASLEHALRYKTDLPDNKLAEHSQTLLDCATCDDALRILKEDGLCEAVLTRLSARIAWMLEHRCGEEFAIGAIVFSKEYGLLCQTPQAQTLLHTIRED